MSQRQKDLSGVKSWTVHRTSREEIGAQERHWVYLSQEGAPRRQDRSTNDCTGVINHNVANGRPVRHNAAKCRQELRRAWKLESARQLDGMQKEQSGVAFNFIISCLRKPVMLPGLRGIRIVFLLDNRQTEDNNALDSGPGSAATLPGGQLRPYPCQGSAATLPTRILSKGQRFLPIPGVSCDPTWPQCNESYRFSHYFKVWRFYGLRFLVVCLSFWATHAVNDSSSSTTFLLSKFSPPLATHALRPYLTTFLLSNFPPLGNPCFQWFKFKYYIPFIKTFPPPLATHALRPYLTTFLLSNLPPPWQPMLSMIQVQVQHSFYQNFPSPLGNPCFATLPDNIPFIKFSPPWQPMLSMIQVQVQHSFYQNFPPPPGQPMLSMIQVQVQHSFYQNFSPPLGNPCFATRPDNIPFIKFSPPWQPMLSMIQVQVQHSFYPIFSPPWQPMLCDPTWQHSFYQIFTPLGNPCFQWFKFKYNIPFIKIFPLEKLLSLKLIFPLIKCLLRTCSFPNGFDISFRLWTIIQAKSKRNILTEWKMKSVIHIDSFLPFFAIRGSCVTLLPPRMFCIAPTTVTENMSAISHLVHLATQPFVP